MNNEQSQKNFSPTTQASNVEMALRLMLRPGDVFDIRALECHGPDDTTFTMAGYFDDPAKAALAVVEVDRLYAPKGTYVTLNPVKPGSAAAVLNGPLKRGMKTTGDTGIVSRRWILIDLDPVRAAGTSSTQAELEEARAVGDRISAWLVNEYSAPAPVTALSGNGVHLLLRVEIPNDAESKEIVRKILKAIKARFASSKVEVDCQVFNASRIVRLYGTVARKGTSTDERPHRLAHLLADHSTQAANPAPLDILAQIAALAPEPRAKAPPPLGTSKPKSKRDPASPSLPERLLRARAYLSKIPGAVDGAGGHQQTWKAALAVAVGFDLPEDTAFDLLWREYNPRCRPPWTEQELLHKVKDADAKATLPRGYLLERKFNEVAATYWSASALEATPDPERTESLVHEAVNDPHRLARIVLSKFTHPDFRMLAYWREEWWLWVSPRWVKIDEESVAADVCKIVKEEFDRVNAIVVKIWLEAGAQGEPPEALSVRRGLQSDVVNALKSQSFIRSDTEQPSWLTGEALAPAREVMAAPNGLFHLVTLADDAGRISPPTPRFFNGSAIDFEIRDDSPPPTRWLKFLDELWPDDPESIALLQEEFGYLVSADTSQHKIIILIGPPRSGKGTIARVLIQVVGQQSVCGPTLASLGSNFGLWPLIGKSVAIISDARLGARADQSTALERLLAISGEDAVNVDRKYLSMLTVRLPVRFLIISNELPAFVDASGAIAARFLLLRLQNSWVGKEDTKLTEKLLAERPGILKWAIAGWKRLRERGHFVQPESAKDLLEVFADLSSPVKAFVQDRCVIDAGQEVECKVLYAEWRRWCESKGMEHITDAPTFGRDLHAAISNVRRGQRRAGGTRHRLYRGISLAQA